MDDLLKSLDKGTDDLSRRANVSFYHILILIILLLKECVPLRNPWSGFSDEVPVINSIRKTNFCSF